MVMHINEDGMAPDTGESTGDELRRLRRENKDLRQQLAESQARCADLDCRLSDNETDERQLNMTVQELQSKALKTCADIIESEAEAVGSKDGLGRKMAKIRLACIAQRLRNQADEADRGGSE